MRQSLIDRVHSEVRACRRDYPELAAQFEQDCQRFITLHEGRDQPRDRYVAQREWRMLLSVHRSNCPAILARRRHEAWKAATTTGAASCTRIAGG
jgi:hypothetical protein